MNAHTATITTSNFKERALASPAPALLDFWGEGCQPCKHLAPVIDELAEEFAGRATVGKVNVYENMDLAESLRVNRMPTLLFFKGGQEVDRITGAVPKERLRQRLEEILA